VSRATVAFPGTCGELFQGTVDGVLCLVSCPIDMMSRIEVSCADGAGLSVPSAMSKTRRALEIALADGRVRVDGRVAVRRVESLPEGKGYASSTADILGALYGLARLSGAELELGEATRSALEVEPTDSIAWPGLALLDHRGGRRSELLGAPPPMAVLVIDEGGSVDTEEFNRADRAEILSSQARTHEEAFSALADGLRRGDPAAVGEAATESAKACGLILAKPWLDRCLSLCRSLGGYGVCTAHSGTLYGVLLPVSLLVDRAAVLEAARRHLPEAAGLSLHTLVPGGPRFGVD